MTLSDIPSCRLQSQQIGQGPATTPAQAVKRLGAVQAQDFTAAKWAIGLRCSPGTTDADVEQAIRDRTIIRTWPMRGTLHFVAAEDVRWMLELLTPRVIAGSVARQRQLGLDDTTFGRCKEAFVGALQGGNVLTRDEMYQALEQADIAVDGQRGYHILWRTAQEGLICFGPHVGKQPAFTLLEEWAPTRTRMSREEALAELARRYFTSHGPASLKDFLWWSGLTAADAKAGVALAAPHLAHQSIEGTTYWMAHDATVPAEEGHSLHLLPGFDEYLLGYRERGAVLDPQHASKIVPGSNGVFLPTVVSDGQVVGTWKRTVRKQSVTVAPAPFAPLDADQMQGFAEAAQRYGQFLGVPAITA